MSYIIELPKGEVLLLAALLHSYADKRPDSELAQKVIANLASQTDCVSLNSNNHILSDEAIKHYSNATLFIPPQRPYTNEYLFIPDLDHDSGVD